MNSPRPQLIRLNKFLAERLGVSRREADELIAAGKITINDKPATLGARVIISTGGRAGGSPAARSQQASTVEETARSGPVEYPTIVRYNGKIVPFDTDFLYLAFHKPVGYVCSRRAQGSAPTLYELLPSKYQKLKTVGRLDKDSSGLIILTNDGDFAFQMTHPKFRKTKIYEVELDQPLQPLHQQMISDYGVMLDDGPSKFTIVRKLANASFEDRKLGRAPLSVSEKDASQVSYDVILTEGRNRQIRRTFAALGYKVTRLHRTSFGAFELKDLKPGEYVIIEP